MQISGKPYWLRYLCRAIFINMRAIRNWVLATFILSFLVIIAGGVVRTTQSGMGCPDWPKCFGLWIPPTNASELPADFEKYLRVQDIDHSFNVYHTWIEYFNRLLGALLGLFAIIQVALIWRRRREEKTAWRLAGGFLVVVVLTGLFGAIVVKLNLAHLSISVHLLFAIILIQIQLALLLAVNHTLRTIFLPANLKKLTWGFLFVLIFHAVMGTLVRMYVDDISKELAYNDRDTWLAATPVAFLIHRSFSWIVLGYGLMLAFITRTLPQVKKKYYTLTGILFLSMLTGLTLYFLDMPALAQPLHLLLATIAITQTIYILLSAARHN